MINTYYICTDEKAYKYAMRYYRDDETLILHCITEKEDYVAIDFLRNNPDKNFYFLNSCAKGFLKADINAIAARTDDYCELIAIPHPERILKRTHKPQEIPFTNIKKASKIFARLKIR